MEDQTHLLLDDELDELQSPNPHTRNLIAIYVMLKMSPNPSSLDFSQYSEVEATGHNLYQVGSYIKTIEL